MTKPEVLLHTVDEAAGILRVGRDTVLSLIRSGRMKHLKLGHRYLVPDWAIEEFIRQSARLEDYSDETDEAGTG